MTKIDLSTAEFVVDLLRKVEELGDTVTDEEGLHISRIEVAEGDEVVGYIVNTEGSWAFESEEDGESEGSEEDEEPDTEEDDEDAAASEEDDGTSSEGASSTGQDTDEEADDEPSGSTGGQPQQGGQGGVS